MWEASPNPSVRWVQLLLLIVLTAFVGAMWVYDTNVYKTFCQRNPFAYCTKSFLEGRKAVVRE